MSSRIAVRAPLAMRIAGGRATLAAALLLLVGVLGACVPLVPGATAQQPIRLVAGLPFEIAAGGQAFVEIPFSYAAFGYLPHDPDLRGLRFQSAAAQPPSNSVRNAFALGAVAAPEGWSLTLVRATARRIPLNGADMSTAPVGVEYRLDMVFELVLAADVAPGSYPVSGLLRSRSADDVGFSFDVLVR